MRETVRILEWEVSVDAAETRRVHDRVARGGADDCTCDGCHGFVARRDTLFPPEALELFERLGIRTDKDTEITSIDLDGGGVLYDGWYHFVGEVLSGPVKHVAVFSHEVTRLGPRTQAVHRPLAPGLSVGLVAHRDALPAEFGDLPVVQLEFMISAAPERPG